MINSSTVILFGRFLYGVAGGGFGVFCPMFVSELCPKEYRGPIGTVNQLMINLGIFFISIFGVAIPNKPSDLSKQDFLVTNYWRIMWGFPAVVSTF